ncbi:hypothetical protein [Novipirellula galeiformis]|uniref:hypothetical protein n=1 Tax=Novipirellula galeiformis TaxID=2528004 RepID=UPI0011B52241|nr:hypothetical protein [Novipirellula galeiformis]
MTSFQSTCQHFAGHRKTSFRNLIVRGSQPRPKLHSGIGLVAAKRRVAEGATVIITGRGKEAVDEPVNGAVVESDADVSATDG